MNRIPDISRLRTICQPENLDVCLYRRLIIRRFSIYLTALFLRMGLSANCVSVIKGVLACAGAALFAPGRPVCFVAGAFLLQLSFVLDACDGEVARFTGSSRNAGGEFIDKIGDTGSRGLFYGAWGWGMYNLTGDLRAVVAGTVMAGLWLVVRFCAVETLLESFFNHIGIRAGQSEQKSLKMLFVKNSRCGRIEYLLSSVFHPWMNMAALAALLSFFPVPFSGLFWTYFILWIINTIRKLRSGFKISNFERPLQ
ncbi:MAG: CDP-alcohol phosphatidyltransferase family protein [Candidatus Aegiribacteria sp.]|nr:CDP-alcohol phosphatidyltransferase family protein [Candidatus Aegiribacteria sp.]